MAGSYQAVAVDGLAAHIAAGMLLADTFRMSNQNNRGSSSDGTSNEQTERERRHSTGGNMGAGKSGAKSFGAEKPEERDNAGSRKPDDKM